MNTLIHEINNGIKPMTNAELVQLIRVGVKQEVQPLEDKIVELEEKLEFLRDGMSVFNTNFQNIGNTLSLIAQKIVELESQTIPTPINTTRH